MPDFSQLDFSNDPILVQVRALMASQIAAAKAQELAQTKQALVDFGDPALAGQLLAGDKATALAAGSNPFSVTRQLRDSHDQNVLGIDEGRNKQNLFYSTTRAGDLTSEGKNYLQSQANSQTDLQHTIAAYHQATLMAQQQAAGQLLSAEEAAYMRALNWWLSQAQNQTTSQSTPPSEPPPPDGGGGDGQYQGQQHGNYWWY